MKIKLVLIVVIVFILLGGFLYLKIKNSNSGLYFNTSQTAVVKQMQQLQRMETAQFTIEKIIEAGKDGNYFQNILYGDKILLIAHGEIIAGFNLANVQNKDIEISGNSLRMQLPAPEILVTSLDNDKTRVYDRQTGLLSKGDKDLEAQARAKAESEIKTAACDAGILDQASTNARKQLTTLFTGFGFTSVQIDIPQGNCN